MPSQGGAGLGFQRMKLGWEGHKHSAHKSQVFAKLLFMPFLPSFTLFNGPGRWLLGFLTSQARKLSFRGAKTFPEATLCHRYHRGPKPGIRLSFHTYPLEMRKDLPVFQSSVRIPRFKS